MQINPSSVAHINNAQNSVMSGMASKKGKKKNGLATLANSAVEDMDSDWDNSISESEFQTFCQKQGLTVDSNKPTIRDNAIATVFQKLDTNGDGKLSQKEWATFQDKVERIKQYMAENASQGVNIQA